MNSKKTHALVFWFQENKYSVVKIGDIFLADDDDEISIEEKYKIKQGLDIYEGVVKFAGSKEHCDKHLKKITTYKHICPQKKESSKQKTLPDQNFNNLKISESKLSLIKSSNNRSEKLVESNDSECELSRKLDERDDLVENLKEKIESLTNEINSLKEERITLKKLCDPSFLKNFVELSIQVMKYVATENQRDEVRQFGRSFEELLINQNYPGHYMSRNLFDRVVAMANEKKSTTSIFRTMATSLVPDASIWASNKGEYMRENFPQLRAAKEFMLSRNINLSESEFKCVLRNLCSESKQAEIKSGQKKTNNIE